MKLSIITICFNADYIEETCRSIIEQTWQDLEWIVIDGGSDQPTLDILNRYRQHMAYFVSEPDEGRYDAMNKGIAEAKGEYLLFLNGGDSFVDASVLERIFEYKPIPGHEPFVPAAFDADICYGQVIARENRMMPVAWPIGPQIIDLSYFEHYSLPHQATFIRRNLFDRCGMYDVRFECAADLEWFMRAIFKYSASTVYIPAAISCYNFEGLSSSYQLTGNLLPVQERNAVYAMYAVQESQSHIYNASFKQYVERFFNAVFRLVERCFPNTKKYAVNFICRYPKYEKILRGLLCRCNAPSPLVGSCQSFKQALKADFIFLKKNFNCLAFFKKAR